MRRVGRADLFARRMPNTPTSTSVTPPAAQESPRLWPWLIFDVGQNMKIRGVLLIAVLCGGCANRPYVVRMDPRVIQASTAERRQWVIKQAEGPGAGMFSRDYEWVLTSKSIGPKEARQLAYLFFYSIGRMGGYFDDPVAEGGRFKLRFHSELGPTEGPPVFVDARTGSAWQEGQKEKIDMLSLIRLFVESRKAEPKKPNKAPEPTSGTVTPPAEPGVAPAPGVARSLTLTKEDVPQT
jgi:hypothetical protein